MASKMGWLLVVLLPALYVIVKDILKIIKLKNDNSSNKFTKFLNRPLITFKKRKLLPYTPTSEIEKQNLSTEINLNYEEKKESSPLIYENKNKVNIETPTIMNFYDEDEEDIDLPSLK